MPAMNKISIIIPVYYNEDTLMLLYEDMKSKILSSFEDYEIVMVDDGSGDSSYQVMQDIQTLDPSHVKLVHLSRNFGEHAAILAGLNECTGDCAVTKQADLQEDSELIVEMYQSWQRGNKVVLAVREDRDDGKIYQFFAGLYYKMMQKFVNPNMPEGGFDCYLLDRQVIEVLKMFDEKNSALTLQVLWVGFKSEKIYFHRKARTVGKSRWTMSKKIKIARVLADKSQMDLAKETGLSKEYISALERGITDNPSLKVMKKLSKALGVPVTELFFDENE